MKFSQVVHNFIRQSSLAIPIHASKISSQQMVEKVLSLPSISISSGAVYTSCQQTMPAEIACSLLGFSFTLHAGRMQANNNLDST